MPWYNYTPITTPPTVGNPNNYTLTTTPPSNCPDPNDFLCAIQAADNNQKPILTSALLIEIGDALNSRSETTNVLLRP